MIEAEDKAALSRGMRGLSIRLARAANRTLNRKGPFWGDRWHGHALSTPRAVRHVLRYVLLNYQKHEPTSAPHITDGIDGRTSAPWLEIRDKRLRGIALGPSGWLGPHPPPWDDDRPTAPAQTWLLRLGWKKHGLLDPHEAIAS